MAIFFIYSIKVALCLVAFYLFYKLFLSRETFHRFNRAVLLGLMSASLLLPLLHVHRAHTAVSAEAMAAVEGFIIQGSAVEETSPSGLSAVQALLVVYLAGVAFFLLREARSLFCLSRLLHKGRRETTSDGLRITVLPGDIPPFSWFCNIVISEKDLAGCPKEILVHERAHAAALHSADILFCNLVIIFQWFNPAAWLFKAELQDVHEYEADEAVLRSGADAAGYRMLLIRKAVGDRLFSLANNLTHSSLKKRLAMMMTHRSTPWQRAKTLLSLPLAALAVMAFATPRAVSMAADISDEGERLLAEMPGIASIVSRQGGTATPEDASGAAASKEAEDNMHSKKTAANIITVRDSSGVDAPANTLRGHIYDVSDEMPAFPEGMTALKNFVASNLKYPEEAIKEGKEGRVIVSFVVDADGTVTSPEISRSVSPSLDREALRVVKAMPKWNPGRLQGKPVCVRYSMPITFKIMGTTDTKPSKHSQAGNMVYFIDGKRAADSDIKSLDVSAIASINVFKDEKTLRKYGAEGTGGILMVNLKNNKDKE